MDIDIIKYGRMLFEMGLNNTHSGNMSERSGNHIKITKHGAKLCNLKPKDLTKVNLNNNRLDKDASVEIKVHRAIYLSAPKVNAIVHAHIPFGVVLSFVYNEIRPIDDEAAFYLPVIPVLKCKDSICSDEVARELPPMFSRSKAIIVKGHGVFAVGNSIEEASMYAGVAESACKIIYFHALMRKK